MDGTVGNYRGLPNGAQRSSSARGLQWTSTKVLPRPRADELALGGPVAPADRDCLLQDHTLRVPLTLQKGLK